MNPKWTERMLKTPDPNKTAGIYFERPFITAGFYPIGVKIWKKVSENGKLRYAFEAIYFNND